MALPSLEDFVAATLEQIVAGVARAQDASSSLGARVSPPLAGMHPYRKVTFDVSVVGSEVGTSGARLKVGVAGLFEGGLSGGSEGKRQSENRVKFSVLVQFPPGPKVAR